METTIVSPAQILRWEPADILKKKYKLVQRNREGLLFSEKQLATFSRNPKAVMEVTALMGEKEYRIKKWKFIKSIIQVSDTEKNREEGRMKMDSLGEGVFQLRNGTQYRWLLFNFWRSEWGFVDQHGKVICTFFPNALFLLEGSDVQIADKYKEDTTLPLLLVMGWYAMMIISEEGIFAVKTSSDLMQTNAH